MMIYLAHNYDFNVSVEFTEEEFEKYAQDIQSGVLEIYETMEIEE